MTEVTTMRGCIALLAACCIGAAAGAQDLTQKVTYKTVAVPIEQALGEISATAHVKLEAATDLDDIVAISVREATLDDFMKQIAAATSCEWKKIDNGTYRLYRPSEVARAEEARESAARLAGIRKAVQKLNDALNKHPVFDDQAAEQILSTQKEPSLGGLAGGGGNIASAAQAAKAILTGGTDQPAGRATARLLSQIDLGVLANLEEGDRVVFSTSPNRMQLALGPDSIDVLNTMVAEQQVWATAYSRKSAGENKSQVESAVGAAVGSFMGVSNAPIQGKPVKALLCVQMQSLLGGYQLRLKLYDARGKLLFQGGQTMYLESSPLNRLQDLLTAQPASTDPEIDLSDDSKSLLGFFRGIVRSVMGGGAAAKDLSPQLLAKLRRPDKYDPLSFIHSEALIAASDAAKSNIVADLPDSIMSVAAGFLPGQKLTVAEFLKALHAADCVDVDSANGWMIVKPTRPATERERRLDRVALAQLISAAQAQGSVPLDDLAAYALRNGPLMSGDVSRVYALLFVPGAIVGMSGMGGTADWDMLRFYGSLALGQRRALGSGEQIPLRNLMPRQMDYLVRMIYCPAGFMGSSLSVHEPGAQPAATGMPAAFLGSDVEPTEALPNGIPPAGAVSAKVKTDQVVQDAGAVQPRIQLFGSFGPQELGAFRALKDDQNMGAMLNAFLPALASFRLGTRTTYDFNFVFTPDVSMSKELQDSKFDPNSSSMTYDELPDDFKKQADAVSAQIKKSGGFPNIFGGGGPAKP